MILPLIAYACVIGLALTGVGVLLEKTLIPCRRPARWVWVGALAITSALTMAAPWRATPIAGPSRHATASMMISMSANETSSAAPAVAPAWRDRARAALDRISVAAARADVLAGWIWAAGSLVVLGIYARARRALSRRRRGWRAVPLRDALVLLSPDDGPALVGVFKTEVVVPEWTLDLDPHAVDLMLEHEHQHQRARDSALLHLAPIAAVLTPWNPAVWWMLSRLKIAVELDCDARVLRGAKASTNAVADYADLLLTVATRRSRGRAALVPATVAHESTLTRRIAAMSREKIRYVAARLSLAGASALALLSAVLLVPSPRLEAQSGPPLAPVVVNVPRPVEPESVPVAAGIAIGEAERRLLTPPQPRPARTVTTTAVQSPLPESTGNTQMNVKVSDFPVTVQSDSSNPVPEPQAPVVTTQTTQTADDDFTKGTYGASDPGVTAPKPKHIVDATYTSAAMRRKISGAVKLEIVVAPDGTVARARVTQSLDKIFGLDDAALAAARQWTFEPGTLNGQAVPILTVVTMEFRLH
jgi:TonB family protein